MFLASIIVPVFNKEKELQWVLGALAKQSISTTMYEVIIVDHGSTDGTKDIVEPFHQQLNLRFIRLNRTRHGPAEPRNVGIEASTAKMLILVDGDVVPCPGFIEAHIRAHMQNSQCLVLGKILGHGWGTEDWESHGFRNVGFDSVDCDDIFEANSPLMSLQDWREPWTNGKSRSNIKSSSMWSFAWGGNLSFSCELVSSVGNFDQAFFRNEDIEFGYRNYLNGTQIMYSNEAFVVHLPHARNYDVQWQLEQHDRELFLHKHPTLEVEILAATLSNFTCLDVNHWLPKITSLTNTRLIDYLDLEALTTMKTQLSSSPQTSFVVIGCGKGNLLNHFKVSCATEVSHELFEELKFTKGIPIYYLLGMALPIEEKSSDCALISDIVDELPEFLVRAVIRECFRVSSRVILLSKNTQSHTIPTFNWFENSNPNDSMLVQLIANLNTTHSTKLSMYEVLTPPTFKPFEWQL